ncbi:MAG: hypothetical protein KF780_07965 [Sphingomonas sp.]|nr:hypothetical protein [Sphingomonas sp.]
MPDDLKDGRPLLLWDGEQARTGCAIGDAWFWIGDLFNEPTHFAEINPPRT